LIHYQCELVPGDLFDWFLGAHFACWTKRSPKFLGLDRVGRGGLGRAVDLLGKDVTIHWTVTEVSDATFSTKTLGETAAIC
jgi:hypothetical protein